MLFAMCQVDSDISNCPSFCPGCMVQTRAYEEVLSLKSNSLQAFLHSLQLNAEPVVVPPVDDRIRYRSKVLLRADLNGTRWEFGITHRRKFLHLPYCEMHSNYINDTLQKLVFALPVRSDFHLVYVMQTMRQMILVLKTNTLPSENVLTVLTEFAQDAGLEGLHLHLNPSAGRKVILKSVLHTIFGQQFSVDEFGFQYSALSFRQLILPLYMKSLAAAGEFLFDRPHVSVADLFSGTGISLQQWLHRGAKSVVGVEISDFACKCASYNAPDAIVFKGKCDQRFDQMMNQLLCGQNELRMYVNPPRNGLGGALAAKIIQQLPRRIAYLSCEKKSLAEDILHFKNAGYRVVKIIPYDFFPFTRHLEQLALLEANI